MYVLCLLSVAGGRVCFFGVSHCRWHDVRHGVARRARHICCRVKTFNSDVHASASRGASALSMHVLKFLRMHVASQRMLYKLLNAQQCSDWTGSFSFDRLCAEKSGE